MAPSTAYQSDFFYLSEQIALFKLLRMMDATLKTQVLIAHAQDGCNDALNELCSRYLPRILYSVRARLGVKLRGKLQSMDVVQEAMLDIVKGIDRFEFQSDGAFLHYVNKIIENNIRDAAGHFAAKKREIARERSINRSSSGEHSNLQLQDYREPDTPSQQIINLEDYDRLERALDELQELYPDYHEITIQTKLERRTYVEIGQELGKSPDSIRMKARRAERQLAKIFTRLD